MPLRKQHDICIRQHEAENKHHSCLHAKPLHRKAPNAQQNAPGNIKLRTSIIHACTANHCIETLPTPNRHKCAPRHQCLPPQCCWLRPFSWNARRTTLAKATAPEPQSSAAQGRHWRAALKSWLCWNIGAAAGMRLLFKSTNRFCCSEKPSPWPSCKGEELRFYRTRV